MPVPWNRLASLAPAGAGFLMVAVAVTALAATDGVPPAVPGLPDPGMVVRWGLPVSQAVRDLAAAATVGFLVLATVVLPPDRQAAGHLLGTARARACRRAGGAGLVWSLSGAMVLVLTYADVAGVSPFDSGFGRQFRAFAVNSDLGRGLAVSVVLSLVVAAGCCMVSGASRMSWTGLLAVLSMVALLPLALVGHSATAVRHHSAIDAQAAHLVAVSVWVGGLVALLALRSRLERQVVAVAVERYSRLAGWAFVLVLASGVLGVWSRIGGVGELLSAYGALVAGKVVALTAVGVVGWWQRRRVVGRLGADPAASRAFGRLAAVEVAVMAVALGLAVALSRTSPASAPVTGGTSPAERLTGYPLPPPLTAAAWFSQWRIDTLWAPVTVLAVVGYLAGVRRLRRRGDRWPPARTASWLGGSALFVWATSGAPGVYGGVLFSMHMVQHMTVAMAVPVLLVLGAPATLALRAVPARRDASMGPREWLLLVLHSRLLRVLAHPVVAGALLILSLVVFYYSPLLELALRTRTGHVLMTAHFLLTGYLFAWVICGPDPGPRRPPYPFRLILLIATMAFHAFIGVAMMQSTQALAGDWFTALQRPWGASVEQDMRTGGALAWALGDYPVAILTFAMAWSWVKADERESRRHDRKADRDGEADLAAYNAYLRGLADGTQRPPSRQYR